MEWWKVKFSKILFSVSLSNETGSFKSTNERSNDMLITSSIITLKPAIKHTFYICGLFLIILGSASRGAEFYGPSLLSPELFRNYNHDAPKDKIVDSGTIENAIIKAKKVLEKDLQERVPNSLIDGFALLFIDFQDRNIKKYFSNIIKAVEVVANNKKQTNKIRATAFAYLGIVLLLEMDDKEDDKSSDIIEAYKNIFKSFMLANLPAHNEEICGALQEELEDKLREITDTIELNEVAIVECELKQLISSYNITLRPKNSAVSFAIPSNLTPQRNTDFTIDRNSLCRIICNQKRIIITTFLPGEYILQLSDKKSHKTINIPLDIQKGKNNKFKFKDSTIIHNKKWMLGEWKIDEILSISHLINNKNMDADDVKYLIYEKLKGLEVKFTKDKLKFNNFETNITSMGEFKKIDNHHVNFVAKKIPRESCIPRVSCTKYADGYILLIFGEMELVMSKK